MKHQSGTIASRDGTPLFYEQWTPEEASWATLVIVQGRGEHTGRYRVTAETFAADGLSVWAVDLRGQGRSGGRRGHITYWRDFLQDVEAIIALATKDTPGRLPFLLGHSMGGLIALHAAVEHPTALAGLIVSSPLCDLAKPVAAWESRIANTLSRWWPTFPFHRTTADAAVLSHDPAVQQSFLTDPLVHFRVTARMYDELRHAMGRVSALVTQLLLPTLVLQAGADRIVSIDATRRMFDALGAADKQLIVYEGWYHEIFNEVNAARVIRDVVAWVKHHAVTRQ